MTRLSLARRAVALVLPAVLSTRAPPGGATSLRTYTTLNGEVSLPSSFTCGAFELHNPVLVGSGSSGAVFEVQSSTPLPPVSALKVSWAGRAQTSVENERRVLQHLNRANVTGVETLHASCALAGDLDSPRTALLLSPFVERPVERIADLKSDEARQRAVVGLADTVVQLLAARVATVDVQLLADSATGKPLLVDFTEARILQSDLELSSSADLALVSGFLSEADALVPDGPLRRRFAVRVMQALLQHPLDPTLQEMVVSGLGL
jgi:hypothetical protein